MRMNSSLTATEENLAESKLEILSDRTQQEGDRTSQEVNSRETGKRSLDELTDDWATQLKTFASVLGDLLSQKLKLALPKIVGGGIYGVLSVLFAFFAAAWLLVAGFNELLTRGYSPVHSALIVAGGSTVLSLLFVLGLRLHLRRHEKDGEKSGEELSQAGKELISLSKDVAKTTLNPKALIAQKTGPILAGTVILGVIAGYASTRDRR
jgi:hypothetical protein